MTPSRQNELTADITRLLEQFQVDAGNIKIRPSTNWVMLLIQIFALIAAMAFTYGKLDGRLVLIEYRLTQIELKVNRTTTVGIGLGVVPGSSEGP